jgi:nitric oxide reductase subunit B
MVVHAVYDAGTHHMKTINRPAFFWILAEAFGNFLGAGVWGFMITLPQINLYAHGTQWTVSHAHFAFWGAYSCGVIGVFYLVLQKVRAAASFNGLAWRWAFATLNVGLVGMAGVLLVSGFAQSFVERALGGSTHEAFLLGQQSPSFEAGMDARFIFGLIFAAGYALLVYDLLTIGRRVPVRGAAAVTP